MKRQQSERLKQARVRLSGTVGATMAELLIVIAIIGVLSGVAFIAVWNYQRSMGQLERDNYAKEIFIAAQNHLTVAKGEGYRGVTDYGTREGDDGNVYYYIVTNGTAPSGGDMFAQMLPFGSIDETVRGGGSYLIRYQPKMGLVLDVFYCSTSGSPSKFNHTLSEAEYSHVMALKGDTHKGDRRTYTYNDGNSILGWYGGEDAANLPTISLKAPSIEVFNGDTLYVKVTDAPENKGNHSLKLILTGKLSGAQKSFVLKKSSESSETVDTSGRLTVSGTEYDLLLDDITKSGMHFRTIPGELKDALKNIIPFIPGEDVTVQAVAYSTSALANTVYSESRTTNSLFADISDSDDSDTIPDTAYISSIRHLENLSGHEISGVVASSGSLSISKAEQVTDLSWPEFQKNITGSDTGTVSVYYYDTSWMPMELGSFIPVNIDVNNSIKTLDYNGNGHSITGINVYNTGANPFVAAGVFGTYIEGSIKDLELLDIDISGAASVGALAGAVSNTTVSNVVARNTDADTSPVDIRGSFKEVNQNGTPTNQGQAGGLIGIFSDGTIQNCAAALTVSGVIDAGGLIGKCGANAIVTGCYSGGHTDRGEYYSHNSNGQRTGPNYNVTATGSSGVAGGLIGDAGSASISYSYSTCSVSGTTAGGFVGSASGGSITNCYATGLVSKSEITTDNDRTMNNAKGAFAGSLTGTAENCSYYSIINEVLKSETVNGETTKTLDHYLGAVRDGDAASTSGIKPFDLNAETFNTFTGAWDNWAPAKPYDSTLVGNYGGKYNLKAILRNPWTFSPVTENGITTNTLIPGDNNTGLFHSGSIPGTAITDYFVSTHYGDWPSPEVFFVNKK